MGVGRFARICLVFWAKFGDASLEIVQVVHMHNFLWEWHFALPPDVVRVCVHVRRREMLLLGGFCRCTK